MKQALFLCILLFGIWKSVSAQTHKPTIFEVLGAEEGAAVSLSTDMNTLIAQKKTNTAFNGTLTTAAGKRYEIQLKPSGRFRRMKAATPPLKIKFKKKELRADGLDTLNKIKIILPWFDTPQGEDLLVKEYLCYRMFEQLSPAHVKAKLLRLTLKSTGGGIKKSYALMLEDDSETAKRLQGRATKRFGIPIDSFDTHQAALTVVFQYFVGNTDWSFIMARNVRLIHAHGSKAVLSMPYDFDFAGMVGAPYASPSSESGVRSVRDRFLMEEGLSEPVLMTAVESIRQSQAELYAIGQSSLLSEKARTEVKDYMDVFFKRVGKKNKLPKVLKW